MEYAREAASFQEAPPSRSLPKKRRWRDTGGEAASLREAPLPQTPSPEEQLRFELFFLPYNMPL